MKREGLDHPKVGRLAQALGCPRYRVWGLLEGLYGYVATWHPDGRMTDAKWAEFCGWAGVEEVEAVLAAMIEVAYLDRTGPGKIEVHDWVEHCDRHVKRKLAERGDPRVPQSYRRARAGSPQASHGLPAGNAWVLPPEPEPEPEPSTLVSTPPKGVATAKKVAKPKSPRWRKIPETETLTAGRKQDALRLGLHNGSAEREWAKFCDHEFAHPRSDIDGTWRNWCRRAVEIAPRQKPAPGSGFVG